MKDYTSENPAFSDMVEILETSDPGHADIINQAIKQLLQNTLVLKNMIGGFCLYPDILTQAQYDALDSETKNAPRMLFVVKKG